MFQRILIILVITFLSCFTIINTQNLALCDSLNETNVEVKSRHISALCNAIHSSQTKLNKEVDSIPDFDLTQIASGIYDDNNY
jgi:hypothetical protein